MNNKTKKYDSTVARIAGNLLAGNSRLFNNTDEDLKLVAFAVGVARAIVNETERTEPEPDLPHA